MVESRGHFKMPHFTPILPSAIEKNRVGNLLILYMKDPILLGFIAIIKAFSIARPSCHFTPLSYKPVNKGF